MAPKVSSSQGRHLKGLILLYEDRDVLVVDKPPGLLTVATDRERERTAYHILTDFVRKGNPKSRNRIFIVHRLDRETSGVLIVAKSEAAKLRLQGQWDGTEKQYLAVVHGKLREKSGKISTYLAENRGHTVYSTPDASAGKLSHTAYETLREGDAYSLLRVHLLTGRKHQIRVHLADAGHPVVGDQKYGKGDGHKRLALHALSISFDHPVTGKRLAFETDVPGDFIRLAGGP